MFLQKSKILFSVLLLVLSFLIMAQAGLAVYDPKNPAKTTGLNETANQGYAGKTGAGEPTGVPTDLPTTIGKIVGAGLAFLGVAFFILIIYGGYTWMFSMGNEQTSTKAKEIIIAAVIGLVIVLMAYAITEYIGTAVSPVEP